MTVSPGIYSIAFAAAATPVSLFDPSLFLDYALAIIFLISAIVFYLKMIDK